MGNMDEVGLIPPEDFAEAIDAFRANPDVDFMFSNAPHGAKLLLGLLFYKAHFGDAADEQQVQACFADIEGSLDIESIDYLIDCDIEANTKAYLRNLRARVQSREPKVSALKFKPAPFRNPNAKDVDYNFQAIKRRLSIKEREEEEEEQKEKKLRAERRRRALISIGAKSVVGMLLLGAAAYGFMWWREYQAEQEAIATARYKEACERRQKEEEEQRLQREKADAEARQRRKEYEAKIAAQRLAREQRNAENAKHKAEREALYKIQMAENEKNIQEEKTRRERFRAVQRSYGNATVYAWNELDKDIRNNIFENQGYFLVPDGGDEFLYEVRAANGQHSIWLINHTGEEQLVDRKELTDILLKRGALYKSGNEMVYCIVPQHVSGLWSVSEYRCYPAELLLGGVLNLMERYRMNTDMLYCEVSYVHESDSKKNRHILVGEVNLGKSISRADMVDRIMDVQIKKTRSGKKNAKGKRAAVVLYDGPMIKRGTDGVTYVPRNPRGNIPSNYYRLYDEAKRLEREQKDAEQLNNDKFRKTVEDMMAEKGCISIKLMTRR